MAGRCSGIKGATLRSVAMPRRAGIWALALAAALASAPGPAAAENGAAALRAASRTAFLHPVADRQDTRASERRPRGVAPPALRPTANPSLPRIVVSVFGDRVAKSLAAGLQEREGDGAIVQAFTDEDAGLSRPNFPEWLESIRGRLAAPDHAAVALIAIGTNDRQAMQGDAGPLEPGGAEWQALYGSRVDATAKLFQDAHVPLIWVGLPAVRSEDAAADYVRINGVIRDHAVRDGANYVDTWGGFTDDAGRYSPVGPDIDGATVKLRLPDGAGFTPAGDRKLASFVESDINRIARRVPPDAALASLTIDKARNFDQALEIDVNAQIRREAAREQPVGSVQPGGTPAAVASLSVPKDIQPGAARRDGVAAVPAAGPVLPLTAPPVSAGGQLAAIPAPSSGGTQEASLAAASQPGPPTPQPGRADDFSWPRR